MYIYIGKLYIINFHIPEPYFSMFISNFFLLHLFEMEKNDEARGMRISFFTLTKRNRFLLVIFVKYLQLTSTHNNPATFAEQIRDEKHIFFSPNR